MTAAIGLEIYGAVVIDYGVKQTKVCCTGPDEHPVIVKDQIGRRTKSVAAVGQGGVGFNIQWGRRD